MDKCYVWTPKDQPASMLTFADADHSADLATTDVWDVSFTSGIALS